MMFQPYSKAHRLVHNRSACEPIGEALRVTTASQQWAYAVEFPLQAVPPSADKGFKIKLRARVRQGAIGLGVLTPDGTGYQHEIQVAASEKSEAVELVLPETAALGSLMLRNTASNGASHVEVEIVGCEFLSDNEEGETTEIVINPEIFRSFRPWSGWVSEGFFADWTGIKTRVEVWAFSADFLEVFNKGRHEKHDVPLTDEHVLDWAPLAQAVQESSEPFRMAALGAGWGRWLAAGSALASQVGRNYRLLGVEAEPQHFEWLLRHFRDNGIAEDRYIAVHAAATGKPGDCWFETGNPQAWYGQSVRFDEDARAEGAQLRRTKGIAIDGVLELLSPLDYMHMDIQGAELDFLSYRPELFDAKVRLVNIGTHSAKIEVGLRQLFERLGWECLYDVRLGSKHRVRVGDKVVPSVEFGDGVQVWRNTKL
jgi:FkbM family methyltransferase